MYISKKLREQVRLKYDGKCAYTGKPLGDDWQVDHAYSKARHNYFLPQDIGTAEEYKAYQKSVNRIDNLLPALRIVNHYKRAKDIEGFREYMLNFHKRLAKLPKKTLVPETERRKEYMQQVADAFDITVDRPFNGIFYFEAISEPTQYDSPLSGIQDY